MANLNDLKLKRIGIFGFGAEGQSLFRFLSQLGCSNVVIYDEHLSDLSQDFDAELVTGKFEDNNYNELEIAFRSPGVQYLKLKSLLPSSVEISSPTNLFFENCKAKTIGITGTKGKSTTALLVAQALRANGKKVFVVGNIGEPMLDVIKAADSESYCVIELSSFQLQDLKIKPETAIILPIFSDHLDYHKDEEEYLLAKKNIIGGESQTLIADLETLAKFKLSNNQRQYSYSTGDSDADFYFANDNFVGELNNKKYNLADVSEFIATKKIPLADLLAAYTFACVEKLDFNLNEFNDFKKLPLRVELVSTKNGVSFFNDSASTNPISTLKAMEMMDSNYYLIMGGSAKGVGFEDIAKKINGDKKIKKVFLFGATANEIAAAIKDSGPMQVVVYTSLKDVFNELSKEYKNVSSVLFSPACASFDQYKNYKERGEEFNLLVDQIDE